MAIVQRISIFGVQVSITNIRQAPELLKMLVGKGSGYVCLPDAYVVVTANRNKKLQQILNNSLLTLPDGSPLVIYAKKKGVKDISSVSGYWLVKELLDSNISHYFYGSSVNELAILKYKLLSDHPNANIMGFKSPPWVELEEISSSKQIEMDIQAINRVKPNIVWVGLNSPKQDYLMANFSSQFENSIMIGIGGVFDYLSGSTKISPEWVKKLSLRWVYRIAQNPKRLFRKTMVAIFGFLWLVLKELISTSTK